MNKENITRITVEYGETCEVDVEELYETLKKLPASIYISLYRKMQIHLGSIPAYPVLNYPACGCSCNDEEKSADDV